MSIVALVTDLIFATRIRSTAEALGVSLRLVRSADDLVSESGSRLAIIDMNASGDPLEAIRRCKKGGSPPQVVAYLSHVDRELADQARAAGADQVLPRSAFTTRLPELLQQYGSAV